MGETPSGGEKEGRMSTQAVRALDHERGGNTYSSNEVSARCDISLRQLQYIDEQGIVPIRKDGHARSYTEADVHLIDAVSKLRTVLTLQKIRKILPALRHAVAHGRSPRYILHSANKSELLFDDAELLKALPRKTELIEVVVLR